MEAELSCQMERVLVSIHNNHEAQGRVGMDAGKEGRATGTRTLP